MKKELESVKQEQDKTLKDVEAKLRQVNEYPGSDMDKKVSLSEMFAILMPGFWSTSIAAMWTNRSV